MTLKGSVARNSYTSHYHLTFGIDMVAPGGNYRC